MKFVCDSCKTKYSIADDRVRGRVLKIRCKTCNFVITVKEDMPPPPVSVAVELKRPTGPSAVIAQAPHDFAPLGEDGNDRTVISTGTPGGTATAGPETPEPDDWYVSFDGEQEGPLSFERAAERVKKEVPRGRDAHAWRPGFFVWLPVEEVPELARALKESVRALPPPRPQPQPPAPRSTAQQRVISALDASVQAARREPAARRDPTPAPRRDPTPSPLKPSTGPRPLVGRETGPLPRRDPTPLKPIPGPRPDPTGPRAALGVAAPASAPSANAPAEGAALMDSKPMALPPPPSPLVPLAPDSIAPPPPAGGLMRLIEPGAPISVEPMQLTRPEKKISREAAAPPIPAPPIPMVPPPIAEHVSPFAAALAQNTAASGEPAPIIHIDTGPVPLPPPPGADEALKIDDASPAIDHPVPIAARPSGGKPVIDTFGGVLVTPANGAGTPAPVVVIAGPAGPRTHPWFKWAAIAGLVGSIALGATVVYLLVRKPPPPAPRVAIDPLPPPTPTAPVDKPITVVDDPPVAPPTAPVGADSKHPAAATKRAPGAHAATKNAADPALSSQQKTLAALYNDTTEHGTAHEVPTLRPSQHSGTVAPQTAILAVVTQNRRQLNTCYERVLKHDSSLKRARLMTHVKIGISGTVVQATISDAEYANSEIAGCITQTIKHWHFPSQDSEYETEFPIILQAE